MVNQDNDRYSSQQKSFEDNKAAQQANVEDQDQSEYKCSHCGWGVTATADICENCGEWLLKGKCNFCYADVEQGQRFCAECGNPPLGIVCDSCGTLSHFDFCPKCNIALTRQANETIQMIGNSVEFRQVVDALAKQQEEGEDALQDAPGIDTLKNYLEKLTEKKTKKKNGFTLHDKPGVKVEDNIRAVEQSRQNISVEEKMEQARLQQEALAMNLLEDTRAKTFPNNQEARKFFGALKVLLPQVIQKKNPIGWRCNAYYNLHSHGPQECSATSAGGTWVYDSKTVTELNYTAI